MYGFSKAAGWGPPLGWPMPGMVPPRPQWQGRMDLKTFLEHPKYQDLNNVDVDAVLTPEASKELDEHLQDALQTALETEEEEELFVASMEGTNLNSGTRSSSSQKGQEKETPSSSKGPRPEKTEKEKAKSAEPPPADDDSSSDSAPEEEEMEKEVSSGPKEDATTTVKKSVVFAPAWRQGSLAALQHFRLKRLAEANEKEIVELQLGQIKYSQDSIRGTFRDGRTLKFLREQLSSGKSLNEVAKISVVVRNGVAYSADNRRLWTFKHSGMKGHTRIPVFKKRPDDSFFKKLTTFNSGETICRRGDKNQY